MEPYEIRLLTGDGATTFFYVTQCANDRDALRALGRIKTVDYVRYEIWSGMRKVGEGVRADAAPERPAA
ncbi:MAG: hypothetical protein WBQ17_16965 [Rhizomicrobium sp.]|jgi:hypothetical protein